MSSVLLTLMLLFPADVRRPDDRPKLQAPPKVNVTGLYRVAGDTQMKDGAKEHSGVCLIYQTEAGGYLLCYTVSAVQFYGVGVLEGNTLSVGWTVERAGKEPLRGVTVYTVQGVGEVLEGPWVSFPPGRGSEKLMRVKEAP